MTELKVGDIIQTSHDKEGVVYECVVVHVDRTLSGSSSVCYRTYLLGDVQGTGHNDFVKDVDDFLQEFCPNQEYVNKSCWWVTAKYDSDGNPRNFKLLGNWKYRDYISSDGVRDIYD